MENKKKLLVVDDDPAICEVISEGLANDFEVVTTEDIDIAFRISTQNQPDLILLDVNIKEENGIDLCARLRKNALTRKIPIVIMTGAGDREKMISSYSIGADDYIEKPIDTKMLSIRLLSRVMRSEDMSYAQRGHVGKSKCLRQFENICRQKRSRAQRKPSSFESN